MTALSMEELQNWVEANAGQWRLLLEEHPEALCFPCDIRETTSVAQLLQHVVAVQLRFAERLSTLPETPYEGIPCGTVEEIFGVHERAMQLLKHLPGWSEGEWEEELQFTARSAGTMRASRRTIFVHLLMHSIRHYAQLATLLRHHGLKANWPMDYIAMGMKPVVTAV